MSNKMFFAPMGGGYEPETIAFLSASGISDLTISDAVNDLILNWKANSLLSKIKMAHIYVGGTTFTFKFNLIDPRDLDVAFRLTIPNVLGWTFASTGLKGNGTTNAANTHFVPSTELSTTSGHLFFYSRTNSAQGYDTGASNDSGAVTNTTSLICRYSGNIAYGNYGNGSYAVNVASTDGRGGFMVNRNDGTNTTLWKNGVKIKTVAEAVTLTNRPLSLFAINAGGTNNFFSDKECAFSSSGDGFTDAEALIYYNSIQTFQTALSRQV